MLEYLTVAELADIVMLTMTTAVGDFCSATAQCFLLEVTALAPD